MKNEQLLPPQLTHNETLPPVSSPIVEKRKLVDRLVDPSGNTQKRPPKQKQIR